MKTIFLMLLLLTGMVKAQIVAIPDANFKSKLLAATASNYVAQNATDQYIVIDANADGEIQESEAAAVYILTVANAGISDLTGIESFVNLRQLYCDNNQLSQLNVNGLGHLTALGCESNQLAQLNVTNLVALEYLRCSSNPIGQIDLSTLVILRYLDCSDISATTLNISGLTNLQTLYCRNNLLTQLDVTVLPNLIQLNCSNNQLTSVNIRNMSNLRDFQCDFNQLTTLDFTGIQYLERCSMSNNLLTNMVFDQLTRISIFDASNNQFEDLDLSHVYFASVSEDSQAKYTGNPLRTLNMKNGMLDGMMAYQALNQIFTWEYICVDDSEIAIVMANQPNVVINTYCSFVPGGDYNTITGNIKYDANNNGCDAADLNFPNIRININDGTNQGASVTNLSGNYTFYTLGGSFDIAPSLENAAWFTVSPTTATIPFANTNNNTTTQDFCIAANGVHPDVEIVIVPIVPSRPGFNAYYQIVYKNKGNQSLSGNFTFSYDDDALDFISALVVPDAQSPGLLNWNYSNLLPFESRSFQITFHVDEPSDTPPVNIDDILHFEATIFPVIGDEIPNDNTFALHQTVVGSYAANAITCIEGPVVAPSEIGNYLHYVINFENTGTASAENIVVKTVIDASEFDIGSLQVMNASNAFETRISGNTAEFIFHHIDLDIGGHGHILLKIKTNSSLVAGDSVSRRADVYFDYNVPVDTGLITTVFENLSNIGFEIDDSVAVAPNPASNEVTVKADSRIRSIEIYDAQGRIVSSSQVDEPLKKLDISGYSKGIYFIKIVTQNGQKVQKIFKK